MSMRVADVRLRRFRATARSTWLFLEVATVDGLVGTGECSDSMWDDAVPAVVAELAPRLRGVDVLADRERLTGQLRLECGAIGDPRRKFLQRTVLGGLDMALCDLAAQAAGAPLWKWLGGSYRDRAPVYANINRGGGQRRPADFAAKAAEAVADGHRKVKVAPFDGPPLPNESLVDTGIAIVAAMREAVGGDIELMVDVHHRLDRDQLADAVPRLDELGIAWLEDAVDVTDPEAMSWLAARSRAPIAGGEELSTPEEVDAALATGHLRVLLLDPKYTAGPTYLRQLAERVSGVDVTYHNPCGPISTAVCAHLATIHPDFTLVELMYGEDVQRHLVTDPPESVVDARLSVPNAPGIGMRLSRELVTS